MKVEDVFSNLPVLETERLVLRKLVLADAGDVFEYARDPEVARYMPWDAHRSIQDTMTFLNSVAADQAKSKVTNWALVYKPVGKVVGTAGYIWWQPEHRRAELGYALAKWLWGKGIMTEAVQAIIKFGFTSMELNRIQAQCREKNLASARVMEHCGMKYEGVLRDYFWDKGRPNNYRIYSILRREWEGNNSE